MARATLKQVLEIADQAQEEWPVRREFALFNNLMRLVEGGEITRDELQDAIERQVHLDRLVQAKLRWSLGWGDELGFTNFKSYFATIPEPVALPKAWERRFERLVLVDERLPLTITCRLAEVKFDGDDTTFIPFDSATTPTENVRWIWAHDGRVNRNRKPRDCRKSFAKAKDEVGLTAFEGVSLYVQDRTIIIGHFMDLSGSVHAARRDSCAVLGDWGGEPRLSWDWGSDAGPDFGSASRGSV